jgi:hypothetical protein
MELDSDGSAHPLNASVWQQRREQLKAEGDLPH